MSKSFPKTVVVDANFTLRAILPTPGPTDTNSWFAEWARQGVNVVAPALWSYECVSAVRHAVAQNLLAANLGRRAVEDVFALNVEMYPMDVRRALAAFGWAGRLRQARAYDGAYVALADELRAELWTLDQRLLNAAHQAGAAWVRTPV